MHKTKINSQRLPRDSKHTVDLTSYHILNSVGIKSHNRCGMQTALRPGTSVSLASSDTGGSVMDQHYGLPVEYSGQCIPEQGGGKQAGGGSY